MKIQNLLSFGFIILFSLFCVVCRSAENKNEPLVSAPPHAAAGEEKTDDFAERLASVQTANFTHIFVFRREDNEILSSEDKKFLKENSPPETNQWILTADKKTAIAGSNYKFTRENLENLKKRFAVEDYSPKNSEESNIESKSSSDGR